MDVNKSAPDPFGGPFTKVALASEINEFNTQDTCVLNALKNVHCDKNVGLSFKELGLTFFFFTIKWKDIFIDPVNTIFCDCSLDG